MFDLFKLTVLMNEMSEKTGDILVTDIIQEEIVDKINDLILNEQDLTKSLNNVMDKIRGMLSKAGGHEVQNLNSMLQDTFKRYSNESQDGATAQKVWDAAVKQGNHNVKIAICAVAILANAAMHHDQDAGKKIMQVLAGKVAGQKAPTITTPQTNLKQKPKMESVQLDENMAQFAAQAITPMITRALSSVMQGRLAGNQYKMASNVLFQVDRNGATRFLGELQKLGLEQKQMIAVVIGVAASMQKLYTDADKLKLLNGLISDGGTMVKQMLGAKIGSVAQNAATESVVTEGSLDLMHLPGDVVAWLYDRPEEQMKAAKEIGVAAKKAGNAISHGAVLRSDTNVLTMHDSHGKGRFHVYPDGSMSFNGDMIDDHDDIEHLVGITPAHVEPQQPVQPVAPMQRSAGAGVEDYAEPMDQVPEEPEMSHPGVAVAAVSTAPEPVTYEDLDPALESRGMAFFDRHLDFGDLDIEHGHDNAINDKMRRDAYDRENDEYEDGNGKKKKNISTDVDSEANAKESLELDYEDILEGDTAKKFKQVKDKLLKRAPKAKTPHLDHAINMWDKVEEGKIREGVVFDGIQLAGDIIRVSPGLLKNIINPAAMATASNLNLMQKVEKVLRVALGKADFMVTFETVGDQQGNGITVHFSSPDEAKRGYQELKSAQSPVHALVVKGLIQLKNWVSGKNGGGEQQSYQQDQGVAQQHVQQGGMAGW